MQKIQFVEISIIDKKDMRYDTCGDWYFDKDDSEKLIITAVKRDDVKSSYLIFIHELIEAILCTVNGTTDKEVDKYDFNNPKAGSANLDSNLDSPYFNEHNMSTAIEWILSREMKLDWVKDHQIE